MKRLSRLPTFCLSLRGSYAESSAQRIRPVAPQSSAPMLQVLSQNRVVGQNQASSGRSDAARGLQHRAWLWALAKQASDGALPSGKAIAATYGRHERWGRLVKSQGQAGAFDLAVELQEPLAGQLAHRGGPMTP